MNTLYQHCLLHMTSFLTFRDTLNLYITSKQFNSCLRPVHKKALVIQKQFTHYLKGKKNRENLLYRYCTKLYNFKPFVISRIFDSSSLYRYKKNNRDFINKVILHLTVIHNRSEEDETDSTLLTTAQKDLFTYVLMYEKIIGVDVLKMLLGTLTIGQLAYVR